MSQDEFAKLFQYMQKNFNEINARLDETAKREDIDRILNGQDEIRGLLDTEEVERAAVIAQLNRHEGWIERASTKLDVSYDASA